MNKDSDFSIGISHGVTLLTLSDKLFKPIIYKIPVKFQITLGAAKKRWFVFNEEINSKGKRLRKQIASRPD